LVAEPSSIAKEVHAIEPDPNAAQKNGSATATELTTDNAKHHRGVAAARAPERLCRQITHL
jgi:hypothetical protein